MIESKNSLEYARSIRESIKEKAKSNKNLATLFFVIIIVATVASPALILISDIKWLSKYIPAGLTLLAAISSYWIQIRKPNERWVLYRTYQREIEFEIDQYLFEVGEYSTCPNKDKLLAEKVSKKALDLHYEWMPMVPKSKELKALVPNPKHNELED